MLRPLTLMLFVLCVASAKGQPPPGYYDDAQGLSGPTLKAALYDIIDGHTVVQYSQLWSSFTSTDQRTDGYVWDIYSDLPGGTAPYLYTFGTDQCGTYNGEGDCYNREHSFPQSWFNGASPMYSDIFHLYPTDGYVNQRRGDLPYGRVGSVDWTSLNGTKTGPSNWPGYSNTVCEPIDAYKGDVARSYFYMMTRYMPQVSGWSSDMLAGGDLNIWATNLLLQWHALDPVSAKETDRNNAIYAIQQNRNPYIDHPEWVEYIWGPTAGLNDVQTAPMRVWAAEGSLHIEGGAPDGTPVMVMDMLGRMIWTSSWTGTTLDLPELPRGFYLVQLGPRVVRINF